MATMTKKYGLMTAIAMVTGVVVGSGVFFKAEKIKREITEKNVDFLKKNLK